MRAGAADGPNADDRDAAVGNGGQRINLVVPELQKQNPARTHRNRVSGSRTFGALVLAIDSTRAAIMDKRIAMNNGTPLVAVEPERGAGGRSGRS